MVSKMKPLLKLSFLKTKGTIRNLFKNKVSGVFTIIMVLAYGGLLVGLFTMDNGAMSSANVDLHISILLLIGFLAIMLFATLMQSRKALFSGEDAFYLFTGPFTRRQIMRYLTFQTVLQGLLLGLFCLFFFAAFSSGSGTNLIFVLLAYSASVITVWIFLLLTDYLYVLSIGDQKYQKYSKIIPGVIVGFVAVVVLILFVQTGNLKTLFMDFVQSDLFYIVPVFGWMKLGLIAFVENNYLLAGLGYFLLIAALFGIYSLFIRYQGDFYEQALSDSLELSKRLKAVKAGKQDSIADKKVKQGVKGKFYQGAYAVMSKNMLLLKKTNGFITTNDLISIAIYIVVTIAIDIGFGMFIYMMVIWVFSALQNSDLSKELKNYQIYLIPDKPFNKLIAVIIPTFLKVVLVTSVSFIGVGLYYQQSITMIMMYLLNILSYTSIFISGSVLSIRILKSRSSPMFENFMKMIVMILGAIPSTVIMTVLLLSYGESMLMVSTYLSLVINVAISLLILFICRNMMNGRELNSD